MARRLIGCRLSVDAGSADRVVARLVEVEAYLGAADEASHAHRGATPRSAIMFGEPGRLYVYLSYGVHHCANIVSEPVGTAGAVLLRAAVVEVGEEVVRRRRSRPDSASSPPAVALLRGPGNLCRGLGIGLASNATDLCAPGSRLRLLDRDGEPPITVTARIGISRNQQALLRFHWTGEPAVSGPRR